MKALLSEQVPLRARIDVTVIDSYELEHELLPGGYVHRLGASDDWDLEPSEEELGISLVAQIVVRHGA